MRLDQVLPSVGASSGSLEAVDASKGRPPAEWTNHWASNALRMAGGAGASRFDSMGRPSPRHDAAESGFTQKALTYIESELFPTLIPPLEARKWCPIVVAGNPGDQTYLWRRPTRSGMARFFAPGPARDLPVVGAFIQETAIPYYAIACKVMYDYFELLAIGAAAANGQPFDFVKEKLTAALEANEKKLDVIAAFGSAAPVSSYWLEQDADVGMTGLLNSASASTYTLATGGVGLKTWVSKTADEVLADLFGIVAFQVSSTFKVHAPSDIGLPISQFEAIANRRMGDIGQSTILEYFLKAQKAAGRNINVFSWQYMAGAGAAGADRMIAFNRDPRMIRHVVSVDKAMLPAETHGLVTEQIVYSKTAGPVLFRPLSVTYSDGL